MNEEVPEGFACDVVYMRHFNAKKGPQGRPTIQYREGRGRNPPSRSLGATAGDVYIQLDSQALPDRTNHRVYFHGLSDWQLVEIPDSMSADFIYRSYAHPEQEDRFLWIHDGKLCWYARETVSGDFRRCEDAARTSGGRMDVRSSWRDWLALYLSKYSGKSHQVRPVSVQSPAPSDGNQTTLSSNKRKRETFSGVEIPTTPQRRRVTASASSPEGNTRDDAASRFSSSAPGIENDEVDANRRRTVHLTHAKDAPPQPSGPSEQRPSSESSGSAQRKPSSLAGNTSLGLNFSSTDGASSNTSPSAEFSTSTTSFSLPNAVSSCGDRDVLSWISEAAKVLALNSEKREQDALASTAVLQATHEQAVSTKDTEIESLRLEVEKLRQGRDSDAKKISELTKRTDRAEQKLQKVERLLADG